MSMALHAKRGIVTFGVPPAYKTNSILSTLDNPDHLQELVSELPYWIYFYLLNT